MTGRDSCSRCGKPVYRRATSAPRIVCHGCRAESPALRVPPPVLVCPAPGCGKSFTAASRGRGKWTTACSLRCAMVLRRGGVYALVEATVPVPSALRNKVKKARRTLDALRDPLPWTLAEVAARDGCVCRLCGCSVDMGLSGLDEFGPTVDHVVSHAERRRLGLPPDDRRCNVQLAHRVCNLRKGAFAAGRLVETPRQPWRTL